MAKLFLFATFMLLLTVEKPLAQTQESVWRVINPSPTGVVPEYKQQVNPFPWTPAPVLEMEEVVVDEAALALAERRALLIQTLRGVLSARTPYSVDFSALQPRGYFLGDHGARILMGQNWHEVGDRLTAVIRGTEETLKVLKNLEQIDPKVSKELRSKIFKVMPSNSRIELVITDIQPQYVEVKDIYGRMYKLSKADKF